MAVDLSEVVDGDLDRPDLVGPQVGDRAADGLQGGDTNAATWFDDHASEITELGLGLAFATGSRHKRDRSQANYESADTAPPHGLYHHLPPLVRGIGGCSNEGTKVPPSVTGEYRQGKQAVAEWSPQKEARKEVIVLQGEDCFTRVMGPPTDFDDHRLMPPYLCLPDRPPAEGRPGDAPKSSGLAHMDLVPSELEGDAGRHSRSGWAPIDLATGEDAQVGSRLFRVCILPIGEDGAVELAQVGMMGRA